MKFGERCAAEFWDQLCKDATLPYRIALSEVKQRCETPEELLQSLVSRLSPDGQTYSTVQQGFFGKKIVLGDFLLSRIYVQSNWLKEADPHSPDTSIFHDYVAKKTGELVYEHRNLEFKPRFDSKTVVSRFLVADKALQAIDEFQKIYRRLKQLPSFDCLSKMCDRRLSREQLFSIDDSELEVTETVVSLALSLVDPKLWLEQDNINLSSPYSCQKETWDEIESVIEKTYRPLVEGVAEEKTLDEANLIDSLGLSCVGFDSQTRKLLLKAYFPTRLAQEARSKGIISNQENESELFSIAVQAIQAEFGLEFDGSATLKKGLIESENGPIYLKALDTWIRQERLAECNLLQHDLLHSLPQPMALTNSRDLGIQQQLRASICGDLDKICGTAKWQNAKSGNHVYNDFQGNVLSYYRVYLSAVIQLLDNVHGPSFGKSFMFKLLSATFRNLPGAKQEGKHSDLVEYCNLLEEETPALHVEARVGLNTNPMIRFAEEQMAKEKQIEELLEMLPDGELKNEILETARDANQNRWTSFMDAMLASSSANDDNSSLDQIRAIFERKNGE